MYKKLFKFYETALENKFFLYTYLLFFFTSPHIKFLNLKLNIFDTGLYVSNLYQIYNIENLNGLFIGHAQIILYFFSFLFFLTDKYVVNLLLIIQSLCLISPIFFYKRNKKKFLYLIFFPLWYINYNGFHIDSLVVPFIYLYLTTQDEKKYYYLIPLFFIKEIFIILALSLLIFEVVQMKNNKKKNLFFIIITSIVGLVLFQIILSEIQNLKINNFKDLILNYNNFIYFFSLFNLSDYSILMILKKLFFMILIFIPFVFSNFKNLKFYFIYVPIFSLYFFLDNINFLKPYFHYSTYLVPFLFFICIQEVMSSKKRILFYTTINLIFTLNFFNPLFYFDNIKFTESYSIQNYKNFGNYKNLDNFLADIEIPENEALTVSNNILHHKIINRSFLLVTDYIDDIDTSTTACRNLKNRLSFFDTNKCEIKSKYALLNLKDSNSYNDTLLKEKNFEIIKKNDEFTFYRSKDFKAIFKN